VSYIPEKLVKEVESRGLNIVDLIISALYGELDPKIIIESRIELAEKYLGEAKNYLDKGSAIQASENMYKVVEECIKALAEYYKVPELEEVRKRGRWLAWLPGSTARTLAEKLNEPRIKYVWSVACNIHVLGFHEAKYSIDKIRMDVQHVEWLLNYTKQVVKQKKSKRMEYTLSQEFLK